MNGNGLRVEVILANREEHKRIVYALQTNYAIDKDHKRWSYSSWILLNDIQNYESKWFLKNELISLEDVIIPMQGFVAVQNINGDILAIEKQS